MIYGEFARWADVPTHRQINSWCGIGALGPKWSKLPGSGHHREWTLDEVRRLRCISRAARSLQAAGFQHIPTSMVAELWVAFEHHDTATLHRSDVLLQFEAAYPRGDG